MQDRFRFRTWIKKYQKLVDVFRFGNDMGTCEWVWHSHIYNTPDGNPVLDNWGRVDERFSNIIERTKYIDCVLEQCTGLKDKNGKLIYECDIVREISKKEPEWEEYITEVKWGKCGFNLYSDEDYDFEVIGNIHENPELLEV